MLNPSAMPPEGSAYPPLQHLFQALDLILEKHLHSWHPLLPAELQEKNSGGNPNFNHKYALFFLSSFASSSSFRVPSERTPGIFSQQTFQKFEKSAFLLRAFNS